VLLLPIEPAEIESNKRSAVAVFDTRATTYRGPIKMNRGGRNTTMSETQAGKRIGDCR
jgi:hypothetical protein